MLPCHGGVKQLGCERQNSPESFFAVAPPLKPLIAPCPWPPPPSCCRHSRRPWRPQRGPRRGRRRPGGLRLRWFGRLFGSLFDRGLGGGRVGRLFGRRTGGRGRRVGAGASGQHGHDAQQQGCSNNPFHHDFSIGFQANLGYRRTTGRRIRHDHPRKPSSRAGLSNRKGRRWTNSNRRPNSLRISASDTCGGPPSAVSSVLPASVK